MNLLYHPIMDWRVDHVSTGSQVRLERRKRKLTLQVVAEATGISVPYLSNLEHGRRYWTAELLRRVERAMETQT